MFVNLAEHPLPPIFGVQQEPLGPTAELRVLFENSNHPIAVRLPDAVYLAGRYHALSKTAENIETILYADWHYSHSAVLTCRRVGAGNVACTALQDYSHPDLQRILFRLFYQLAGRRMNESSLGIGILGYAPSVGQIHSLDVANTPGLSLRAICDLNPKRLEQARQDFSAPFAPTMATDSPWVMRKDTPLMPGVPSV
jgi:hypothetical protein